VGRYVRHLNRDEILIRDGGYFTRTGATFDVLTAQGFQEGTRFHPTAGGVEQIIPAQGPKWPWLALTPWAKAEKGGRL
jgi:hypothetical protein